MASCATLLIDPNVMATPQIASCLLGLGCGKFLVANLPQFSWTVAKRGGNHKLPTCTAKDDGNLEWPNCLVANIAIATFDPFAYIKAQNEMRIIFFF